MILYFKRRERDKKLETLQAKLIELIPQEDFMSYHGNQLEPLDIEEWIAEMVHSRHGCDMLKSSLEDLDEATRMNPKNEALRQLIDAVWECYDTARKACREAIDSERSELQRAISKRWRGAVRKQPAENLVLT